mmetsp:Transcript_27380/g.40109  ORF Transcript_27380/g.40109 Transcript_27380/m.40109 type:complete len:222 (-) Transcript_27380:797-1462(-)
MNGTSWKAFARQHIFNIITRTLRFDKNQNEPFVNRHQKAHECFNLVLIFHKFHRLCHILAGRTNTTDGQKDVIVQKVTGKSLDICRKGGAKHHRLTAFTLRHAFFFDNTTNLRFKTHIQHTIGLIQNKESDIVHGQTTTFNHIDQSARRGHQQITATFNLTQLVTDIGTTIHHDRGNTGGIGKFACLVLNLRSQLTRGSQNESFWVDPTTGIVGRSLSALG